MPGNATRAAGARAPELDGLRGIAIALVMVCHFSGDLGPVGWHRGLDTIAAAGWVGVDLFFVLSGFLITGILLAGRGTPAALGRFYARRALRIWPVYLTAVVVLLVILPRSGIYSAADRAWFAEQRWYYWLHGMDLAPVPAPDNVFGYHTIHFWSLSLEEQFYLAWPLAVLTLPVRRLKWCLGIVTGSELALRAVLGAAGSPAQRIVAQHLLHLQPLGAGAWLAIVALEPGGLTRYAALGRKAVLGGTLVIGLLFLDAPGLDKYARWPFALESTACAVAFGGMLIHAVTADPSTSLVARLVRHRSLGALGFYSYAIYVVHMPLVAVAERLGFSWRSFPTILGSTLPGYVAYLAAITAASWGVALVSWHGLEKHCLGLRRFFPRPAALTDALQPVSAYQQLPG